MKTALIEFRRDRVTRRPTEAASQDIVKTIVELRAALKNIKKAISAVERLAIAQFGPAAVTGKSASPRKRAKRLAKVVDMPRSAEIHDGETRQS